MIGLRHGERYRLLDRGPDSAALANHALALPAYARLEVAGHATHRPE
jgi:hypothetical protein